MDFSGESSAGRAGPGVGTESRRDEGEVYLIDFFGMLFLVLTGRSISAVYTLRVREGWVQFPAARQGYL